MTLYDLFILIFIFLIGLAFGSFINVVVFRIKKNQSLFGRSECPYCKKKLKSLDLIPVLSFLFLKGKCRYCEKRISWQYPLVELATGIIFLLVFLKLRFEFEYELLSADFYFNSALYLFFAVILIIIFVYDYKYYIIPNKVLIPAIAVGLIALIIKSIVSGSLSIIISHFYSVLLVFGFFLILYLISKGKWIGAGDVKFGILIGLIIPWPNSIVVLFLSFVLGAMAGLILIALRKKKLKEKVPFGTFLVVGTFLTFFIGDILLDWYLNLIF